MKKYSLIIALSYLPIFFFTLFLLLVLQEYLEALEFAKNAFGSVALMASFIRGDSCRGNTVEEGKCKVTTLSDMILVGNQFTLVTRNLSHQIFATHTFFISVTHGSK